jgi:hypothetical protein
LVQGPADVIDGEVRFAQGDALSAELASLGRGVRAFGGVQEEKAVGVLAELVDQGTDAGRGIPEAGGDLGSRLLRDTVGAEGFVLAMGSVAGLEEALGEGW